MGQSGKSKGWRKVIAVLTVFCLISGCEKTQEISADTEQIESFTTQEPTEILGWKVTDEGSFTDDNEIGYNRITFVDYGISVALPTALWDPDSFYNMSEEGGGTDALDLPLTDWTDDDMFCVAVPSTAYFSLTETEEQTEIETLKSMSDRELMEKKLKSYDNITALDETLQREETGDGYQTTMKIQITLNLYEREFLYEGYWVTVYHDGKALEFSYGEARMEDSSVHGTAGTVLENFIIRDRKSEKAVSEKVRNSCRMEKSTIFRRIK